MTFANPDEHAASPHPAGSTTAKQLPAWIFPLLLVGLGWICLVMFTGGAIMPWAHIGGGLGLCLILTPILFIALGRFRRVALDGTGLCLWLGFAVLIWTALQVLPLPADVIAFLSPHAAQMRRDFGTWNESDSITLSLAPQLTIRFLLIRSIGFAVFATVMVAMRGRHWRWLARVIALATGLFALYGLALFSAPAPSQFKPFGVPLLPGRISGPLVNPNRFAFLMELGLPFCFFLLSEALSDMPAATHRQSWKRRLYDILTNRAILARTVAWGGTSVLGCVALVLTLSRGGLGAMLVAAAAGLAAWARINAPAITKRTSAQKKRWGLIAGLLALAITIYLGHDPLLERLKLTFEQSANRLEVWHSSLPITNEFWLTGVGAGSFREVFPSYQSPSTPGRYFFTHNEYLNTAIDLGFPGFVLVLGLLIAWFWLLRRQINRSTGSEQTFRFAAAIGVLAVALHSIVDFGLQDPSVLWFCAFIMGAALCPVTGNRAGVATAGLNRRTRVTQTCAALGLAGTLVLNLTQLPAAVADWIHPGSQWVHLDPFKDSINNAWTDEEIRQWRDRWQSALAWQPKDPTALYQTARAEYYLLLRELSDQPVLAPSLQGPDGLITQIRGQRPYELSADQRQRLAAIEAMLTTARQQTPLNPELILLRLRLAVLVDDLPVIKEDLARIDAVYHRAVWILPELAQTWTYLYLRQAPSVATEDYLQCRENLTRAQLAQPIRFDQSVAFAFNRGVTLQEIDAWIPTDRNSKLKLAQFLESHGSLQLARERYFALCEGPSTDADDRRIQHTAYQSYLELCFRLDQTEDAEKHMSHMYADLEDFERESLFKHHLRPYLNADLADPAAWRTIFLAAAGSSPVNIVEAARLEVTGRLALLAGDVDTAVTELNKARKFSTDNSILFALARCAMQQDKYEEAANYLEDMLQTDSQNAVQILGLLALSYERSAQWKKAILTYHRLGDLNPNRKQDYAVRISQLAGKQPPDTPGP